MDASKLADQGFMARAQAVIKHKPEQVEEIEDTSCLSDSLESNSKIPSAANANPTNSESFEASLSSDSSKTTMVMKPLNLKPSNTPAKKETSSFTPTPMANEHQKTHS